MVLTTPTPGHWVGWTVLFALSAALMLCSSLAMRKVPDTKIEETQDKYIFCTFLSGFEIALADNGLLYARMPG